MNIITTDARPILSPEVISAMSREDLFAEIVRFTECAEQARGTMPPFKLNPLFDEGSEMLDTAKAVLEAIEEHRRPGGMTIAQMRGLVSAFVLIDMAQQRMGGRALC